MGAVTIAAGKTLTVQGGSSVLSGLTFGDATACLKVYGEETATPATALALDGAMTKTGTLIFDCPLTLDSALAFGSGGESSVTQNVTLRKDITATRLITGNGDDNVTNIVQEGGDITLSQVDDGTPMASLGVDATTPYAILFGHWPSTSNYQLKAGSVTAERGYAHLGWDGGKDSGTDVTVTVGQSLEAAQGTTALLKVKGFTGNKRGNSATLTVNPSGTLAIGSAGFTVNQSDKHVILAGGTLLAYETLTTALTANGLEIAEPSTVAAVTGATLTLDKLAGGETLTIGTADNAGTVVLPALTGFTGTVTVAAGTAVLTTLPTANDVTVKAGATLKCHVSFEEADAGVKASRVQLENGATMVFVLPNGLEIAGSEEGGNELAPQDYYTWAPTVDNSWSTLGNWTKDGVAISELPGEDACVRIRATEATTLTMDVADTVNELTIEGGGTVTLAGETLTVGDTLFVVTDVASSATAVAAPKVSLVQGYTLSLTGGNLPAATTYSGDGTLAITGSVTYAAGATIEAPFVVATGGTLDLAGQTLTSPVTLQGGTLVNTSETRAYARKVTLAADSKIVCDGALTLSSGTNARDELTLGGYTLTKTGNAGFAIEGTDLAAGTLDIQAGSFCLSTADGGDCACTNTTLKFSESSSYTVYGWVGIAGAVTVDVADGKTLALGEGFTFKGTGSLKKTGAGTLELPFKRTSDAVTYTGTTTVEGGTFILNVEPEGTFTRTVSVANGATFTKKGKGTLKLGSALLGAGTYEVTEGIIATGNYANGNFGGTWKIGASGTLTNSGSGHYHSIGTGKVIVNGLLELEPSITDSHLTGAISGAGRIHVKTSASIEGDTADFTGTLEVDAGATLASLNTVSNYGILCNGTITPADGKTLTIASGKTLAGTGSINSAVTFAAGSTLEVASAEALTVTGAVTMPTEGTVTVTGATTEGQTVLTCVNPADVAPRLSGAPAGLLFAANDAATAVVLKKPALTLAEGTTGALSAEATATLEALAAANGLATATVSGTTKNGTEKLTAEAIGDALELFTNVATVDTENGTITVAYDFGIANLSITTADALATTLRITFKVQGAKGTSGADFAEGIVFAVTDVTPGGAADTVLASTANDTLQAVEDSHDVAGERTFTCDLETRTLQLFRVRVQTP